MSELKERLCVTQQTVLHNNIYHKGLRNRASRKHSYYHYCAEAFVSACIFRLNLRTQQDVRKD